MFAFIGTRHDLLAHLPKDKINRIVEVGVCEGINARWLLDHLEPEILCLIDRWLAYPETEPPFYYREGAEIEEFTESYLGGPGHEQATFDRLFTKTQEHFKGDERVQMYRASSGDAVAGFDDESQDLIYIDGDHAYEAVIDDLFNWERKLSDDGYMVLNDHVINPTGSARYGVVQAVTTFLRRRTDYYPIAINLSNYADLIIGKRSADHSVLLRRLVQSNKVLELPDAMLSNFHRRTSGNFSWLSFN